MKNQQSFRPTYFLLTGIVTILLANCSQPGYIQQNDLLVANGQTETAIANYRQLLVEDPADSERHYQLAKILSRQKKYSEAIKSIEKAIIIDHLIDRYQLLAGKIKYLAHDNFEAINHLTNALVLNPQYLEAYYYLGLAQEKTGQTATALVQLQTVIAIEPLYFDAHLAWAEIKFRQLTQTGLNGTSSPDQDLTRKATDSDTSTDTPGQAEDTRREFLLLTERLESALKIKSDSVPGHLLLSKIYYSLGAEYKARILLENWLRDFEHDDRILLALAQIEYRSGRFDAAARILSQQRQPGLESQVLRLKIEIKNVSTPETATKIHALLKKYPDSDTLFLLSGQWELKQGNIVRAERMIQKSLEIKPDFAEAYFTLSKIHKEQNDIVGSQFALRKALQLAPTNLKIKLQYLHGLAEGGNWYEAEQLLTHYSLNSDHPEVLFLKGIIAKEKGNFHQAELFFLNAQKKQYSVKVETQLADLEIRQGQYHSAESRLKRINAIYPHNLNIALTRARLMQQIKQSADIPSLLTPYLSAKQGSGKVHLLLAESLIQQGNTEAALKTLANGLKRWPRSPDLVQAYTLYLGLSDNHKEAIPHLEEMQTFTHKFNRLFYYRLRSYYFKAGESNKFKNYIYYYRLVNNTVQRLTP